MRRHTLSAALIAASLGPLALMPATAALAQAPAPVGQPAGTPQGHGQPMIVVTGEGEAMVAPDMAVIQLSVVREAETARAALDANTQAMSAVMEALSAEGIAERDLQTSGFSVMPQYVYPDQGSEARQPRITGYQVTNSLSVRLRDLDRLGAVLDQAVTLGVNQGGDILFTNDDPAQTLTAARQDAIADARDKAETLSSAAGVRLGRIWRIDETSYPPQPLPMMRAEMTRMAADTSVPVAPGENTYRVSVNVTWELAE
jgi:uncharacterized protein